MLARVKDDCRFNIVTAFAGNHYNKLQWLPVPAGSEEAARNHGLLDVMGEAHDPEPMGPAGDPDPNPEPSLLETLRAKAKELGIAYAHQMKEETLQEKIAATEALAASSQGEPADGEPADGEPADGEPADGEPADGEPADGEPSKEV